MNELYFKYLCSLVETPDPVHGKLLQALYNKPFVWFVPHDDNRASDAAMLRDDFSLQYTGDECLGDIDVNMLELIISLAYRCQAMAMSSNEMSMHDWFWILLNNIGLSEYRDGIYDKLGGDQEVDRILTVVIDRTYTRNGRGGLFPLTPTSKNKKNDQRKIELWYQMCAWIVENYYS